MDARENAGRAARARGESSRTRCVGAYQGREAHKVAAPRGVVLTPETGQGEKGTRLGHKI